ISLAHPSSWFYKKISTPTAQSSCGLICFACIFEVQKKMRNMKLNEQKIDVYIYLLNSFFLNGIITTTGCKHQIRYSIHWVVARAIPCATYSMWYSIGKLKTWLCHVCLVNCFVSPLEWGNVQM
ncbi:hypothetical protein ACJX0J_013270, partial [Zea mays]